MTLSVCVAFFVERMGDLSSDASQGGRLGRHGRHDPPTVARAVPLAF